jgi:hypothetical protein
MRGQLLKSVLYSKGFGDTIKSGISFALHSQDLNLCNFIQSTEDDLRASTQNTVFPVSPAGVQQAIYVCNV